MNPLHRFLWNVLMRRRRNLRFVAARFPWLAPWAVRARFMAHLLVGNLHATTALVAVWQLAPLVGFRQAVIIAGLVLVVGEVVLQLGFSGVIRGRAVVWLVGWREGWSTRAYLPAAWSDGAAKTAAVQAEVGTNAEPTSPARLRPIADHPKLSLVPLVEWPTVSFWVGPPPGRTFVALDEMAEVLAAHLPRCHDVTVEYERVTDSVGRISFTYANVLNDTEPAETLGTPAPSERPVLSVLDGGKTAIEPGDGMVLLGSLPGEELGSVS